MRGCRPLTDEEIERVSKAFEGPYALRDKALFILGIKSGFRISELLSLRVGDVFQYGKVLTHVKVQRRYMKRKVESRLIPLHPEAQEAISEWLQTIEINSSAYLFVSGKMKEKPINRRSAWRILKKAFHDCKLTGTLGTHTMRKSFAQRIYEKLNRDIVITQRALGHRNINSTVQYLSFNQSEVEEAILAA